MAEVCLQDLGFLADVMDAIMIDESTGEAFAKTTLQTAGIDVMVGTTDVKAGRGNATVLSLHSGRDIEVNLSDVQFSTAFLAQQLGTEIKTGVGKAYARPQAYTVIGDETAGFTIELPEAPLELYAYHNGVKLDATTDYTIVDKLVTITKTGVKAGDVIDVRTYQYATSPETQTIEFSATKFPKAVKLVLDTIEINEKEEATHTIQVEFYNASPDGNFSINTASERAVNNQDMKLKIMRPSCGGDKLGELKRIPIVATVTP